LSSVLGAPFFLQRLKPLIDNGRVFFAPRNQPKTRQFLLDTGWSQNDIFCILKKLESQHYYAGPEPDHDGTASKVMVFIYPHESLKLYIKLKIWTDAEGDAASIMSFHEEGQYE